MHSSTLLDEVNTFDKENDMASEAPEERSRIKDYKKTSMAKGMMVYEAFLRKLEQSYKGKAIAVSDAKMEF
jgi:DNA primase small subunit